MQPMAMRSPATLTYRDVVTIRVVVVASVVAISGRVTYSPSAPQHSWWGIGSPVYAWTPTADSARTPRVRCVLCRGRIGLSRLSFRLVGVFSALVGGGSWRRHRRRGGRRMPCGGRAGSALSTNVLSTLAYGAARLRAAGLVADEAKPEATS